MSVPRTPSTLERWLPSMFQRRLALLLSLALLSMLFLAAKTAHLAILRHDDALAEAQARLVRHQWTPTVRGKILDRKGRVLARDRAGYDLAIDYQLLSGEWADKAGRDFARSCYREQWPTLPEAQRDQLIRVATETFEAYASSSRDELAALAGCSREEVDAALENIRARVRKMGDVQRARATERELKAANERNEIVTPELEASIRRRTDQPIREERSAHRLPFRLTDEAAFRAQFLMAETFEVQPIPGELGPRSTTHLSRLPGVHLFDSGEREYPGESVVVDLDRSTFPSTMTERSTLHMTVDGVASHIVGWMRDEVRNTDIGTTNAEEPDSTGFVSRAQFLRNNRAANDEAVISTGEGTLVDRGEYRPGDRVGAFGIERGREHDLRGLRGYVTRHVDTETSTTLTAKPGHDLTLTIDVALQARIQAIMSPQAGLARVQPWHRPAGETASPTMPDGTPINGAAVVLDIDTGEIMAMVSMPECSRGTLADAERSREFFNDPVARPLVNRCIDEAYPPGSIVKPIMLSGSVTRGDHALNATIACNGHLLPNNENMYRCWIFKRSQHGKRYTHTGILGHELDGSEAIMVSCNVYFFTLGRKLGPAGVDDVFHWFGLGEGWDLGIGHEYPGNVGRPRASPQDRLGDAIQMGIGQGPVTWTPLHAANAYATLARYGYKITPRLVRDARAPEPKDLRLDAHAVSTALDGLRRSVNERMGTGNHLTIAGAEEPIFNASNVDIWGKTGTAEAPDIRAKAEPTPPNEISSDSDGENPTPPSAKDPADKKGEVLRHGDHSWFVVLVGPRGDRPRYVISVIMEYAGSGGKVSGPICNQIVHALTAEGYL